MREIETEPAWGIAQKFLVALKALIQKVEDNAQNNEVFQCVPFGDYQSYSVEEAFHAAEAQTGDLQILAERSKKINMIVELDPSDE